MYQREGVKVTIMDICFILPFLKIVDPEDMNYLIEMENYQPPFEMCKLVDRLHELWPPKQLLHMAGLVQ